MIVQGYNPGLCQLGDGVQVHPTAIIADGVELGPGTVVWAYAVILAGVRTGPHCSIGAHAQLMRDVQMGESCRIGGQVQLAQSMRLGDRVFVGPFSVFANDRYPRVNNIHYKAEPPTLEDDVNVGAGVVVLPGVTLREGCMIGGGAVVTRDVAPWTTVVGTPAHPILRSDESCTVDWVGVSLT